MYLSRVQYTRLLDAAVGVVVEEGVARLTARRVSGRAGMSSKTFYDLFADGEDCLLAVFDRAVGEWAAELAPAWAGEDEWAQRGRGEDEWVQRVRAALVVLLGSLERDPAPARVVFVDALGAGPRVLARRVEVLDRVAMLVDEGREGEGAEVAGGLPPMTAAAVVGAAFSMIHARLVGRGAEPGQDAEPERDAEPGQDASPLLGLLNDLMATVVLPYRGREAAARELSRPAPQLPVLPAPELAVLSVPPGRRDAPPIGPLGDFRLTVRRHAALSAVAELCGEGLEPCNREVRARAGIPYDGQASHLMMDLETQGLVENTRTGLLGTRKAWRMTDRGLALLDANRGGEVLIKQQAAAREQRGTRTFSSDRSRETPARGRNPRFGQQSPAGLKSPEGEDATQIAGPRPLGSTSPADFRLTVRTQMALVAVAEGSARGAYPSNLQVARQIGVSAKAAVSRMMARLQDQGLVENTHGRDTKGIEKAWRLTPRGQAVLDAHRPVRATRADDPAKVRGGKLVPKRGRPAAASRAASSGRGPIGGWPASPIAGLTRPESENFRLTVRTHGVLTAIAEHAGASNREVAVAADVRDEGQISKLLARLADRGLIYDTARAERGKPKAWRLTPPGEALLHANPAHQRQAA